VTTAWRYIREAVDLLTSTADDLAIAMDRIRALAYSILDGTLIRSTGSPTRSLTTPAPSGRHRYRPTPPSRPGRSCQTALLSPPATAIVQAILVLHHVETDRYPG
jgi:hypothetical protein